jgi:DtxR family Mn-dependent transcriptional regulator
MLGKRAEDYIEAIYSLSKGKGYTKVKELATLLGVKPASVSEMLEKLSNEGYVVYRKRLFVSLTDKGIETAKSVRERRDILVKFLTAIGVPKKVAEHDACILEHILHPATLTQLKKFVRFIETSPSVSPRWLEHFREFCRTGRHPCTQKV